MYLNELLPEPLVYELVSESGPPHDRNFVMSVKINDDSVQGAGRSKKLAKAAAAQVALFKLFNIVYTSDPGKSSDWLFSFSSTTSILILVLKDAIL